MQEINCVRCKKLIASKVYECEGMILCEHCNRKYTEYLEYFDANTETCKDYNVDGEIISVPECIIYDYDSALFTPVTVELLRTIISEIKDKLGNVPHDEISIEVTAYMRNKIFLETLDQEEINKALSNLKL